MSDKDTHQPPHDAGHGVEGNGRAGESPSLIERVVGAFDLGLSSPRPVPRNLAHPLPKPAVRHRRPVRSPVTDGPEGPGWAVGASPVPPIAQPFVEPLRPVPVEPAPLQAEPPLQRAQAPFPVPPAPVGQPAWPTPSPAAAAPPAPPPPPEPTPSPAPVPPPASTQPPASATPVAPAAAFHGTRHRVDRQHLRDQGYIVPEGSVTALLEEFRIVKRLLLQQAAEMRREEGTAAQRVLICSPHPGEGKTFCAVNLALSIAAEKESEVLLVDADFAKPSVLSALGLPGGPGLMDALVDPSVDVADCVIGTDIPGLWVLPAGDASTFDTEYLSSSRTLAVLDRLTAGAPHRMVIFDSPPALAASPAAEIAKYVAQALLVVRADVTGQGALEDAISLLSGCPNIQLLLNAVSFSPSGRRFGSYYGYGG